MKLQPKSCLPLVFKKSVAATSVLQARVYGPEWKPGLPSKTSHYKNERILSALLVPIIPAALVYPNMVMDLALTSTMMLHTHWGFQCFIADYFHGPVLPRVLTSLLMGFSLAAFGGLLYLNYNDVGFCKAVLMLYSQL